MTAHAVLSASSAARWLACPPSARAAENIPEKISPYAMEGSLAHAIAELKLRKYFIEPMSARTLTSRINKLKKEERFIYRGENGTSEESVSVYDEEMLKHTDAYLDFIKEVSLSFSEKPYAAVEKKVDFSHIVPEGFGTCDCILIGGKTMHVIDFKYGKGVPVSAEHNPQMQLYALGALAMYGFLYPIETIKLSIVQPRIDNTSTWELKVGELTAWGESIKPIAKQAFEGGGEFKPGDHCRFCKLKGNCRARTEEAFKSVPTAEKPKETLTDAEISEALAKADFLQAWAKDLQEFSLKKLLDGGEIPGWKAVHGRAVRRFTDADAAFKAIMAAGVEEAMLYERKPLTLAAIEKVMGKQPFAEAAGAYIETPPGKPTLVPESDKREAIKKPSAEEAFQNIK